MTQFPRRRLPAEWAPQSAVMLTWPHGHGDWAASLPAVETVFVRLAAAIAARQPLLIACHDEAHRTRIRQRLEAEDVDGPRLRLAVAPSDDSWTRDHGPLTVIEDGRPHLLDFRFNGWGGKFPAEQDNRLTRRLHAQGVFADTPLTEIPLTLEGGAVETDGLGTLLATRSAVLTETRNPGLDQTGMEAQLREWLGMEHFLWLDNGHLEGDDTDGHIDTLARFVDPHTIAYVACDDPRDAHFEPLQLMAEELRALRDTQGRAYRLVPLPWPAPKYDPQGQRLPATYANFLIIEGAVLVPTYADAGDRDALQTLQACFPDREVIGIDCLPLIAQHGSLHCVTMQLPAGVIT